MKLFRLLALALSLMAGQAALASSPIRVEPPNWWVGMREQRLQLMLHGPNIAQANISLSPYPGVRLVRSQAPSGAQPSPNYRFVDLDISPQARAGELSLALAIKGQNTQTLRYRLQARVSGSAQRQGFGPQDAVYLVVPDRFARAGQAQAEGMKEGIDRADPGGRHGGDLAGLRKHLDYIASMGFTQVWPTPTVENNSDKYSYHGYAATDFYRVDPRLGSLADYQALVSEARRKGIGFIQDIVLNHIGSEHWWMKDLPTADWLNRWPSYTETHHARVSLQDPNGAASDRKRFTKGWFVPTMPDLNQAQPQLANYLTQMTLWWIETTGLSGIRTDTYSYSDRDFLSKWSARVMAEYPKLNIVGEEWSPHPAIVAYWQRGKKNHDGYVSHAPSLMDFPLYGALLASLTEAEAHDGGFTKLHETLAHDFVYAEPSQLMLFEGNHDTPRLFTALKGDPALVRMALTVLATTRRIPQFFYGTELLLESPAQRDDGRLRADMPGGWAGDAVNAFTGEGLSTAQRAMQDFVRRLFNWRKTASLVHTGRLMQYAPMNACYVYFRYDQNRRLMVVLNKAHAETQVDTTRFVEMIQASSTGKDIFSGQTHALGKTLTVPARTAMVLEISP